MTRSRALAALAVVLLTSCAPAGPADATVELTDRAIALDTSDIAAGDRTLTIHNGGTVVHELAIFRTDLDPEALPQSGEHLKLRGKIAEKEHINAGRTTRLSVGLTPGRYVLVCDLPGHYAAGMRTTLTVH